MFESTRMSSAWRLTPTFRRTELNWVRAVVNLNPGICSNLTQFFPRQERRREPALSRRQTKEFGKLSLGGSARIRVGNKDHC
jgi:hypothetical protein